jgi:replicative DNA helicase
MVQNSFNKALNYIHISQATDKIISYIDSRRKGVIKSLKTPWEKLDNQINGGLESGTLLTLAGISGSGKSSFANMLETGIFDMNPNEPVVVLNFNFEMDSARQIGRKLSSKLNVTVSNLYSGTKDYRVTDEGFDIIYNTASGLRKYPIFYVDLPGTVEEVEQTIHHFLQQEFVQNKHVVVFIDHVLLARQRSNESERQTITELQYMFMRIKKLYKITIIQLSQLNRSIEEPSRIANENLHFPMRSDLFAADSIYQASDLVIILHRPELLNIQKYGPGRWETKNLVYAHVCKNREGEPFILCFENQLKYNRLIEYNPPTQ